MLNPARSLLSKNLLRPRPLRVRSHAVRHISIRGFFSNPTVNRAGNYMISTLGFVGAAVTIYRTIKPDPDPIPNIVPHLESESTLGNDYTFTEDQVTEQLSCEAYSISPREHCGVSKYDGARVAANSPCEDKFTHGSLMSPRKDGKRWLSWGVFDGHLGWQTAELLSERLAPFVVDRLGVNVVSCDDDSEVSREVMQAFVDFDDAIMRTALDTAEGKAPLQEKIKALTHAYAGSCALLSLYDPSARTLHVACTGDSRAVLGEKQVDGTWKATELSIDQDGSNEDEISRINRDHPGEQDIAKDGRILGMMCSRAFGDVRLKLPHRTLEKFSKHFRAPRPYLPAYPVLTPPYLTAEPVVTSTRIDSSTNTFLIIATDGLWWKISSHDAVNIVGKWLDEGISSKRQDSPYSGFDFGAKDVPWRYAEECSTFEDDNAAVHLIRNAMGGSNRELVAARLAYWDPRKVRDDVTAQVVFFKKE